MAALTATQIAVTGTTAAPAAVAASDTIAQAQFGPTGVILRVINAHGSTGDNVSVADPGKTPAGNPGTVTPVAVAASTTKTIFIPLSAIDPATGLATVTHSSTASVTYELYRV